MPQRIQYPQHVNTDYTAKDRRTRLRSFTRIGRSPVRLNLDHEETILVEMRSVYFGITVSDRVVQIRLHDAERRLLEYENELVVTDRRIRHAKNDTSGHLNVVSTLLEDLCSSEFGKRSHPSLLGIAGALLCVRGYAGEQAFLILGILSAALLGAYFLTRKVVLELKSATATITIEMKGSNAKDAYDFIDRLEHIRHERLTQVTTRKSYAA